MKLCREYHHEDGGNNTSGDGNGDVDDGMRNDGDELSNFILWFWFVYNGFGVLTLGIMLLVHKRLRRRRKRRATKARIHHNGEEGAENDDDERDIINDACSLQTTPISVQYLPEVEAMEFDSAFLSGGCIIRMTTFLTTTTSKHT